MSSLHSVVYRQLVGNRNLYNDYIPIQWYSAYRGGAYRGTPLIGTVGWKFDILQLKSTPRIGAAFACRGTSNRVCFLIEHIFVYEI